MIKWFIAPILNCDYHLVQTYWQTLYMEGLLDKRMCNVTDPTWTDVQDMIRRCGSWMFHVLQTKDDGHNEIVADFMLENFTGKAAQIHFSVHPKLGFKTAVQLGCEVSVEILEKMELACLFGLTPVSNREACLFVLKTGFKKIGILPGGILDRGQIVDAMITVKERYGR